MLIEFRGVSKSYGDKEVLQNITLNIPSGAFLALLGPSGCGKTTLLSILAGFQDIQAGELRVAGEVWARPSYIVPPEVRNVGMVFQDFALWPHMSVFENVAFGLKVKRLPRQQIVDRVEEVLSLVRMQEYRHAMVHQLSGGQKQRIAIARALAPNPQILLMDEPLSSLDTKLREQMRWEILEFSSAAKTTTIYVTHDQIEALSMASHIVLLNAGKVEQTGSPQGLYTQPSTAFAAHFMGAANVLPVQVVRSDHSSIMVDWKGYQMLLDGKKVVQRMPYLLLLRPHHLHLHTYDGTVEWKDRFHPSLSSGDHIFSWTGVIVQRAYHGAQWLYKVEILLPHGKEILEVWQSEAYPIKSRVWVWTEKKSCTLVAGGESEQSRYQKKLG